MIVQALDKSDGFANFRRLLEGAEMKRVWAANTMPAFSPLMTKLENILSGRTGYGTGMALNSRRTYVYSFRLIPKFLKEAFTADIIRDGWAKSFILPFNQRGALTLNGSNKDADKLLTGSDMDGLYRFIENVGYAEVMTSGTVLDATMEKHCAEIVGRPPSRGSSLPTEQMPIVPATIAAARAAAPLLAAVPRMGPTGRREFVAARCVARCAGGGSVIQ